MWQRRDRLSAINWAKIKVKKKYWDGSSTKCHYHYHFADNVKQFGIIPSQKASSCSRFCFNNVPQLDLQLLIRFEEFFQFFSLLMSFPVFMRFDNKCGARWNVLNCECKSLRFAIEERQSLRQTMKNCTCNFLISSVIVTVLILKWLQTQNCI